MSSNLQSIKARFGIVGSSSLLIVALDRALRIAATWPTDKEVNYGKT
ncbi:MAG: hypothetical protein IT262_08925 [Saprospiraceae bacterium]|nr:hypothetical protein [Saprospiraceae bacterium]